MWACYCSNIRLSFLLLTRTQGDDWQHSLILDDNCIQQSLANHMSDLETLVSSKAPLPSCCPRCRSMLFSGGHMDVSELQNVGRGCQLCTLVLSAAKLYDGHRDGQNAWICGTESALVIEPGGQRILRLCTNRGWDQLILTLACRVYSTTRVYGEV